MPGGAAFGLSARVLVALLLVTFLDELGSGVAPAGASPIALDLAMAPGTLAGLVLAGFHVLAVLVEPALLRWAETRTVRLGLALGLGGLALSCLGASIAGSGVVLIAMLALYGPASGLALSVSEGALVEAAPERAERTLTWLSIAGVLGDVLVPGLLAVVGWRLSFGVAVGLAGSLFIVVAASRSLSRPTVLAPDDEDEDEASDVAPPRLRDAVRQPTLLGWTLLCTLGSMMDEVLTAFAAVHLHERLGGGAVAITLTAFTVGGLLGLLVLERALLVVAPMRLLAGASLLATASFGAVILADGLGLASVAMALLGAAVASFHPITKARCYAALPGHPGVVNGVASLMLPVEIAAPLALGTLATTMGSGAALLALMLAPVLMGVASFAARRRP